MPVAAEQLGDVLGWHLRQLTQWAVHQGALGDFQSGRDVVDPLQGLSDTSKVLRTRLEMLRRLMTGWRGGGASRPPSQAGARQGHPVTAGDRHGPGQVGRRGRWWPRCRRAVGSTPSSRLRFVARTAGGD